MPLMIAAILTLALSCSIVRGAHAASPITCTGIWAPSTSEAALRRHFGPNVRAELIEIGEGEREDGSVIYPNKPRLTVFVLWKDSAKRQIPSSLRVRDQSRQVTYGGIGIGTTLKDLERLNGRPFELAGFDFDYSGTVTSWLGGDLDNLSGPACEIKVRLEPTLTKAPTAEQIAAHDATMGDRWFKSSDANMQLLNPRVYEVLLIYR